MARKTNKDIVTAFALLAGLFLALLSLAGWLLRVLYKLALHIRKHYVEATPKYSTKARSSFPSYPLHPLTTPNVATSLPAASTTPSANNPAEPEEGNFWESHEPFPVEATLELEYRDAEGRITKRIVEVWRSDRHPHGFLVGFCHLRRGTRTFRLDRIQQCVVVETGEIINDVGHYLRQRYEGSPQYAAQQLLDDEYDTLRILLYVGKADGQLREKERAIIRDTCKSLSAASTITDASIDQIFHQLNVPSAHAFKMAVTRLKEKPEPARRTLVEAAHKIVATQKNVHPAEAEALAYMQKRLGQRSEPISHGQEM